MQQKVNSLKVPVGIKSLAQMMAMEEVEVRFFPKVETLREILKDYNYGILSKTKLIEKLEALREECVTESLDTFAEGIRSLKTSVQYHY